MKTCAMCGEDREETAVFQVAPATWNSFHDYVDICPACRDSKKFQTWSKAAASKIRKSAARAAEVAEAPPAPAGIQISHRQTGALLHTVAGNTLAGADLSGASLSGANLQAAALRGTDLHCANLRLADLSSADLRGADLRAVNLRGADLRGADLREARLYRAEFHGSLYDAATRWPQGFDPRASGAHRADR